MNIEVVTVQDCVDNYEKKGRTSLLNDGKWCGFQEESYAHEEKWIEK